MVRFDGSWSLPGLLIMLAIGSLGSACAAGISDGGLGGPCSGKCDSADALSVSQTWVPEGGFVEVDPHGHGLRVEPAAGVTLRDLADGTVLIRFSREGYHDVIAERDGAEVGRQGVRVADTDVRADVLGPQATEHVVVEEGGELRVHGTVIDALGEPVALSINGQDVPVGAEGRFEVTHEAAFGINFLELDITDAVGNVFSQTQSFIAAERFGLEPQHALLGLTDEASNLFAAELGREMPNLVELEPSDDAVFEAWPYEVYLRSITLPGQRTEAGSIDLRWEARGRKMHVWLTATGDAVLEGWIDGALTSSDFTVRYHDLMIEFDVSFRDGRSGAEATLENVAVSSSGTELDVHRSLIPDVVYGFFFGDAEQYIANAISEHVGPYLTKILGDISGDSSIDGGDLPVSYKMAAIRPDHGSLEIEVEIDMAADADSVGGAAVRWESLDAQPGDGSMRACIGYNAINQYLYRLWIGGQLQFELDEEDLAEAIGFDTAAVGVEPRVIVLGELGLPPVASHGSGDSIQLSFGEFEILIAAREEHLQASVVVKLGGTADVTFRVVDGRFEMTPELRDVYVSVEDTTLTGLDTEVLERTLTEQADRIVAQVAESIETFPVPAFELSDLGIDDKSFGLSSARPAAGPHGFCVDGNMVLIDGTTRPRASGE